MRVLKWVLTVLAHIAHRYMWCTGYGGRNQGKPVQADWVTPDRGSNYRNVETFASKFSFCTGYRDSGIVLAPECAVDRIKSPSSTPVGTCAHQIDHYH